MSPREVRGRVLCRAAWFPATGRRGGEDAGARAVGPPRGAEHQGSGRPSDPSGRRTDVESPTPCWGGTRCRHCPEGRRHRREKGSRQDVPGPHRWPRPSASRVRGDDSFCFHRSRSQAAAPSFKVGRLPSKARCRAVSRDAAGNRIRKLSSGFLSVCGGGHACVVFLSF